MSEKNGSSSEVFDFQNVVVGMVERVQQGKATEQYPQPATFLTLSGGVNLMTNFPPNQCPAIGGVAAFLLEKRGKAVFVVGWSFVDAAGDGPIVNQSPVVEAVAWRSAPVLTRQSENVGVVR